MGHHIDALGRFKSDKHPDLPPDRIRLSFERPESQRALWTLAEDYDAVDPELAEDIRTRLLTLGFDPAARQPGLLGEVASITGRVLFRNRMGRRLFLRLLPGDEPMTWRDIEDGGPYDDLRQVLLRRETVGEEAWAAAVTLDLGVVITCTGPAGRSRVGESHIEARTVQFHWDTP